MRKIFRMGYEPCKGDCYEYDDVLPIQELDPEKRQQIMDKLLRMHNPMCGNVNLRYGIDFDEERKLFIGFFYHYGALESFLHENMLATVDLIADSALEHFASERFKEETVNDPGLGRSACAYGTDETLVDFVKRSARSMSQAVS